MYDSQFLQLLYEWHRELSSITEEAAVLLGCACLKDEQKTALHAFVSKKDTFVSLPTGYMESLWALLCYHYIFIKLEAYSDINTSIVMFALPLIALMKGQLVFKNKG